MPVLKFVVVYSESEELRRCPLRKTNPPSSAAAAPEREASVKSAGRVKVTSK
jgi:hypothetical protein